MSPQQQGPCRVPCPSPFCRYFAASIFLQKEKPRPSSFPATAHRNFENPNPRPRPPAAVDLDGEPALHRGEAMSAFLDGSQSYGEDDDFSGLYDDVNIGDGFLSHSHPLQKVNGPPEAALPPDAPGPLLALPQRHRIKQGGGLHRPGGNCSDCPVAVGNGGAAGGVDGPGGTTLFVGELQCWTTDADLEAELSKYGPMKEMRSFDEKRSGKPKRYCQVDLYDPDAAAACEQGMNGQMFSGRPCVAAFAMPDTVRQMGEAQVHQGMAAHNCGKWVSLDVIQVARTFDGGHVRADGSKGGKLVSPDAIMVVADIFYGGHGRAGGSGGGAGSGNWGRGGGWNRGRGCGIMRNNRMRPIGSNGIMGNGGMLPPPPPMLPPGGMPWQGFGPTGCGATGMISGGRFAGFPGGTDAGPFPWLMGMMGGGLLVSLVDRTPGHSLG
ncbi:hypothetical protein ACP70R_003123 [Stipagrostis hirtigluma subsp. patula]